MLSKGKGELSVGDVKLSSTARQHKTILPSNPSHPNYRAGGNQQRTRGQQQQQQGQQQQHAQMAQQLQQQQQQLAQMIQQQQQRNNGMFVLPNSHMQSRQNYEQSNQHQWQGAPPPPPMHNNAGTQLQGNMQYGMHGMGFGPMM